MISPERRSYSMAAGRHAERRFVDACEKLGMTVTKSTQQEDRFDHVDFWLGYNGRPCGGVDVKGNNLPDEIWCEFKNISGNKGWMYGKAAVIAFDMPEEGGFCIVDRQQLADYCERETSEEQVKNKRDAYKKRYTRKDRKDCITKLHLKDLKEIESYRVWPYAK
tara:strand:- start:3359 stop:3850 length:492 start_codon:yes stop_codon:yes gene_type:complete